MTVRQIGAGNRSNMSEARRLLTRCKPSKAGISAFRIFLPESATLTLRFTIREYLNHGIVPVPQNIARHAARGP